MSDNILSNIMNAAGGQPYNGSGISLSGAGWNGSANVFNINGNLIKFREAIALIHSLERMEPVNFNESVE